VQGIELLGDEEHKHIELKFILKDEGVAVYAGFVGISSGSSCGLL
jgi:hypothetical protein